MFALLDRPQPSIIPSRCWRRLPAWERSADLWTIPASRHQQPVLVGPSLGRRAVQLRHPGWQRASAVLGRRPARRVGLGHLQEQQRSGAGVERRCAGLVARQRRLPARVRDLGQAGAPVLGRRRPRPAGLWRVRQQCSILIYQRTVISKCEQLNFIRITWMMMTAIKIGYSSILNNFKLKIKVKLYMISYCYMLMNPSLTYKKIINFKVHSLLMDQLMK